MTKEQFIKYVNDFKTLDGKSLVEINLLIEEFPYFQSAWVLYAKNLHNINDVRFESKLKIAATHVPDRKVLKHIIEDKYQPSETITVKKDATTQETAEFTDYETNSNTFGSDNTNTQAVTQETEQIIEQFEPLIVETEKVKTNETELQGIDGKALADDDENIKSDSVEENIADLVLKNIHKTDPLIADDYKTEPSIIDGERNIDFDSQIVSKNEDTAPIDEPIENIVLDKTSEIEDTISDNNVIDKSLDNSAENSIKKIDASAADRILQTINDIKTGDINTVRETSISNEKISDLQQIIEQRLAELQLSNVENKDEIADISITAEKTIAEAVPNNIKIDDVIDFEKIAGDEKHNKSDKEYVKPELKLEEFLDFNFNKEEKHITKKQKNEVIDKFIASDPRIIPQKNYTPNGSFATDIVLSERDELFSETLANIYIKQNHFDKAILTYEKLCLKYPEKSIYFVAQIEKIKKLIKNKQN